VTVPRRRELDRRRTRRAKLAKLRRRYAGTESQEGRTRLIEKIVRVAPGLALEGWLGGHRSAGRRGAR
jgi:hypothetical protein